MFANPDVQFVNINVTELDAIKEAATRRWSATPARSSPSWTSCSARSRRAGRIPCRGRTRRRRLARLRSTASSRCTNGPTLSQAEAIGLVNAAVGPRDVVVNAAGSMPGDLHRLWRPGRRQGVRPGVRQLLHGLRGGRGARREDRRPQSREVFAFIGDGTYLMASQEIMTAVQERLKITVLLVDNYGYGSIAALCRKPVARRALPAGSTTGAMMGNSPRTGSESIWPPMQRATVRTSSRRPLPPSSRTPWPRQRRRTTRSSFTSRSTPRAVSAGQAPGGTFPYPRCPPRKAL